VSGTGQTRAAALSGSPPFSLARFLAILLKEFIQMRRDRITFGMMVGLPVMQLLLFGFAINADLRSSCRACWPSSCR
jgi:hypothetical protein